MNDDRAPWTGGDPPSIEIPLDQCPARYPSQNTLAPAREKRSSLRLLCVEARIATCRCLIRVCVFRDGEVRAGVSASGDSVSVSDRGALLGRVARGEGGEGVAADAVREFPEQRCKLGKFVVGEV